MRASAMCEHSAWLQVSGSAANLGISDAGRLSAINETLSRPAEQYPSLIFCVGKKHKTAALRELFPENNVVRHAQEVALARLYVDNSTILSKNPLLFAESNPDQVSCSHQVSSGCHETTNYLASWGQGSLFHVDVLYSRLFFLFTDLICIFAADFRSLQEIINLIVRWCQHGSPSSLSQRVRPRIIIVSQVGTNASGTGKPRSIQVESLDLKEAVSGVEECFASIEIVRLYGKDLSIKARFMPLKGLLLRMIDSTRERRTQERCLFSASHMAALFSRCVPLVARSCSGICDVIQLSRLERPVPENLAELTLIFLTATANKKLPYHEISSSLASAFLMNAFPPLMHRKSPSSFDGSG